MENELGNLNPKKEKIQRLTTENKSSISYIIDKSKIKPKIDDAKRQFIKWKNNEKKYETSSNVLTIVFLILIIFDFISWSFLDISIYLLSILISFICIGIIVKLIEKFDNISLIISTNSYRSLLDSVSVFADLKPEEILYISIVRDDCSLDYVNLRYIYTDERKERENIIKNIKIVHSDNVDEPVLMFDRMEYWMPKQ